MQDNTDSSHGRPQETLPLNLLASLSDPSEADLTVPPSFEHQRAQQTGAVFTPTEDNNYDRLPLDDTTRPGVPPERR